MRTFLSEYLSINGKTYYPGIKCQNKYITTGTRIYQYKDIIQHIPRHIYHFGRYLGIRYSEQPENDKQMNQDSFPLTTTEQTATTTPNKQQNTQQPIHEELPNEQQTTNEQNQQTPIPQNIETPNLQLRTQTTTEQEEHETTQTELQTTDTETDTDSPVEQTDNYDTETNPDSDSDSDTNLPRPTLHQYEKKVLPPTEQQSFLYWRGMINFEGKIKKDMNYTQTNSIDILPEKGDKIKRKSKKNSKDSLKKRQYKLNTVQKIYIMTYEENEDYLRQQCCGNDIKFNKE